MARLCQPSKVSLSVLTGLMLAYLVTLGAANANPARFKPHVAHVLAQGGNVTALAALIGVVAAANRRNGCGGRPTWAWILLGVLTTNLAARLVSMAVVPEHANAEAKFVRWDTAAKTVGMLAVLAEMYYSLVPRARFRTVVFLLGVVFVLPAVLAVPKLGSRRVDPTTLVRALDVSAEAYAAYDGKDHNTRVVARRLGDVLFVGFAGTENARDAKIDVNIADKPVGWLGARVGKARSHAGFLQLYESVRPRVWSLASGAARVAFVGHSLGGALATLAAMDAAAGTPPTGARRPGHVTMVSFGGPQVGDANLVRAFDTHVHVAARVVNPFDPVPKALSAQLEHTKGYHAVTSMTKDSPLTAHDLATYRLALSRPRWLQILGVLAPVGYVAMGGAAVLAFHMWRRSR